VLLGPAGKRLDKTIQAWLQTFVESHPTLLTKIEPVLAPHGPRRYRVQWEGPDSTIYKYCAVTLSGIPTKEEETCRGPGTAARRFDCLWNNPTNLGFDATDESAKDMHLAIWPCLRLFEDRRVWIYGQPLTFDEKFGELLAKSPERMVQPKRQKWWQSLFSCFTR
jgi:hypothetical protein